MARVAGKIHLVSPVGEVYLWLYTPRAADNIRARLEKANSAGNSHSLVPADITLLFKDGRPVMQPNPRRRKDAVLYKLTYRPKTMRKRNFYASDYDSRFYNWLFDIYKSLGSGKDADSDAEAWKARDTWAPMIDHATHPAVVHPIPVELEDDPDYDPDAHQSSRD